MAKAFIQGMKDIPSNIVQHFQHAANAVTKVTGDPNATWADYKEAMKTVDQDFKNACSETGTTASTTARKEFEEHILKYLNKEDAERWFEHNAKAVKDLAEGARHLAPKINLAAKAAGLAITAMFVAVIGIFMSISGNKEGRQFSNIVNQNNLNIAQAEFNLKLAVSTGEFMGMINGLNIPNIPPTVLVLPAAPVAAAYIPPPMAMPAAVEAIEQAPMEVEVDNDGKTYTGTTTVGQVYRMIPQARQQIETHVSTIKHEDWDPWQGHLHEILNPHEHDGQQHQVNIDVDAGFASAHFH